MSSRGAVSSSREAAAWTGDVAINAQALVKQFGTISALESIDLSIPRGEVFGLVGPNGAGKSTLVRILCGVLRPSSGTCEVAGYPVDRTSRRMKRLIGYMPQSFSLYQDLTVGENISFFMQIYLGRRGREGVHKAHRKEIMRLIGLEDKKHQLARHLSEGWKQRLAFACALVHDPPILFLDEPTARVDPIARRDLWDLIHDLSARGRTFLVTTQFMEEAERCHRIGFLHRGRIVALGTGEELRHLIAEEDVLVLKTSNVNKAFLSLRALEGISQIGIYGDMIRILAPTASRLLTSVKTMLASRDIEVVETISALPTLDDVFIRLAGSAGTGEPNSGRYEGKEN